MADHARHLEIARELQLERSHVRPLFFHGPTMEPFLRDGDHLTIEPVQPDDIRIGDLLCYHDEDRYPVRRVAGVDPATGKVLLRCDNRPFRDFHIELTRIHGRVTARHRGGRVLRPDSLRWRFAAWYGPRLRILRQSLRVRRRSAEGGGSAAP